MDTKLSNAQSNKLDPRLLSWLDGEEAAELGLAAGDASDSAGTVRVSVQLSSPLAEDGLARYEALGLIVEAGADDLFGQVTREGLSALARDSRVVQIQPVGMSAPSGSTF
jgi:hypothetical protein